MNRRDFLSACAALGASLPFFRALGCTVGGVDGEQYWDFEVTFTGKVVVVGAGAAGLAAGYLLTRYGIDFEIVEAAPEIGGRTQAAEAFVDVPIDVGAEWIHEDPSVLAALIDDPGADGQIDVLPYSPETIVTATDGRLVPLNAGSNYYSEYKFKRTTWFSFLRDHIAHAFWDQIQTGRPIVRIDTSGDRVVLTDTDGQSLEADAVLLTVPVTVIQRGKIEFVPPLSDAKRAAFDAVDMPNGIKVFLEFSERFYPDMTIMADGELLEKLYIDGLFRKDSAHNMMTLFYVGHDAAELTDLSDDDVIQAVVDELDGLFDGQASDNLVQALVQNWSAKEWIGGCYGMAFAGDEDAVVDTLNAPIGDRVFFAGEALSRDNGATVPGAMQSAYEATRQLLEG